MNIIETIRAEIERLKKETKPQKGQGIVLTQELRKNYDHLLSFLSTLKEQPVCEGLEEEIGHYLSDRWKFGCVTPITPVILPNFTTEDLKGCARHFAQWGAEQRGSSETQNDIEQRWDELQTNFREINDAFEAGKKEQKEQMLKEAVPFYQILKEVPPGPQRETTRVIIIEEDAK